MKGKSKLLSPLLLIAMFVSLFAGAMMAVVPQQLALADPDPTYPYFTGITGTIYTTPSSAYTGYLYAELYGTNSGIDDGVYCLEFDFDLLIPEWGDWPELSTTGHFVGWAYFDSGYLELDGEITLPESVPYGATVPYGSSTVSGGKITLYNSPTSYIIPDYPNSYFNVYYWWGRSYASTMTVTNGTLTECPALLVDWVEYVGPTSGTWVGDTFKIEAEIDNEGSATATNVVAHIDIYGDASLVPGESADKYLGDMGPNWHYDEAVVWTLQCDESGDVYIVVTATCDEGNCCGWGYNWDDEEVTQIDPDPPVLEVWLDDWGVPGATFSTEQKFDIEIDVVNHGDVTLTNVTVGYICDGLVSPLANSTVIAVLEPGWGGKADVTFENVTCMAPGITTIRAWAEAETLNATLYDSDSSYFWQEAKAHLKVELTLPWGDTIEKCDCFPVTVYVSNTGEAEACAMVTVNITGNVTPSGNLTTPPGTLYPIPGGEARYYTWELCCTDAGDVVITVVDLYGWDHNTWELVPAENLDPLPANATVHQVLPPPLIVEIDDYPECGVGVCDDFIIDALIYSDYWCLYANVTDVWATIHIDGPASLTPNETATKYIGDVLANESWRDDYKVVGWTLHCDEYGPVNITVTAAGIYDGAQTSTTSDPVTVTQKGAVLNVTSLTYSTCDSGCVDNYFYVTARVTNEGNAYAYDVLPNLTIDDPTLAHIVSYPSSADIDSDGDWYDFTWTLHCDDPGTMIVNVTPAGWEDSLHIIAIPDSDIHSNETEVVQKPTLITQITTPSCDDVILPCTDFTVTAKIWNYAGYDVPSVYAWIEIYGPASLVAGEEEVQYLGTVTTDWPPTEDHGYQEASWTLHCDAPGEVYIYVYPGVIPDYDEICLIYDYVEVCQAELVVDIVIPDEGAAVNEGQTFAVKATVTNISNETIEDVYACIDTGQFAILVPGEYDEKYLGRFLPGAVEQVSWTLRCACGLGDNVITVDAEGWLDGEYEACVLSDSVVVHQNYPACLSIDLDVPLMRCVCDNFYVTATVSNTGDIAADDVEATISLSGGVDLVTPGATIDLGTIPGGSSKVATWTVHCNSTVDATITVNATGKSALTGADIGQVVASTPVSQYDEFYVQITEPAAGAIFSSEQDFDVTATVCDCLDTAINDVSATITLDGELDLVSPDPTQIIDTICPGCCRNVTWEVHCTGAGSGTITVMAQYGEECVADSISVDQVAKAHLVGNIFFPDDGDSFCALQEFHVKASVENTGTAAATDVTATLVLDGDAEVVSTNPIVIGTIYGGEEVPIMWTVECTGAGVVTINIDLAGNDENTGVAIHEDNIVNPCPVEVNQLPLAVEITAPQSSTTFTVHQDFYVNALVTNTGTETIEDVVASIGIIPYPINPPCMICYGGGGDADLWSGGDEDYNKDLGDIRPGETHDVTWTLHCECSGDVMIVVTASVEGTDAQITSDPVIVHQVERPELEVVILSPYPFTTIGTGQEFMVTAMLSNYGEGPLADVSATIGFPEYEYSEYGAPSPLSVVSPSATQEVGEIPGGSDVYVSWTLRCDWADEWTWVDIRVTAEGRDPYRGGLVVDSDWTEWNWVEVLCYPAAHLVVDISAPADGSTFATGQSFDITATVTNTGWADAWDVSLAISFLPEGSVVLSAGGYTQNVGNLAGHGQDGNATVTWHVYCKQVCSTTITVTPAGQDEFGYDVQTQTVYYDEWFETGCFGPDSYSGWFNGDLYYEWWEGYFWGYIDGEWYDWYVDDYEDGYVWLYGYFGGAMSGWFSGWITTPEMTAQAGAPIEFIEPDSITVKQVETPNPASLAVVLSYPEEVYAGHDFAVTVTVSNVGETDASGANVTLSVSGPASIKGSATKNIGAIAAGSSATVSWELECEDVGGINVAVSATGTGLNTASDSGAVQQIAAPAGYGGLIGGIIGGLALLGIILCFCMWWTRRRKAE